MATRRPSSRDRNTHWSDIVAIVDDPTMQSRRSNKRRINERDAGEEIIEISSDEDEAPVRKKSKTTVGLENLMKKLKQVAYFCRSGKDFLAHKV